MELRHMRYFLAIVDADGFREASRSLHVAQPALTQTVISLEDELGVKLLVRGQRGSGTGVTVGRHPMAHHRGRLREMKVICARDLSLLRHGVQATVAGCVIARQRPGTAHGLIFLSLEDESGIANAIVDPDLYERTRSLVTYAKFLLVTGTLQNVDKVIHVRAKRIEELFISAAPMQSHDFH